MSGQDVQDAILTPMQRIFTPPKDYKTPEDQQSALREYVSALEHFPKPDLEHAWRAVVAVQTARIWPMPGVFVVHAVRAKHDRESIAGTDKRTKAGKDARSHWAAWEAVRRTPLATDAAARGVAWALKCAILAGVDWRNVSLDALVRDKAKAAVTASRIEDGKPLFSREGCDLGIMLGKLRETSLTMYHQIQVTEATTAQEIGYTGQVAAPEPELDIAALGYDPGRY